MQSGRHPTLVAYAAQAIVAALLVATAARAQPSPQADPITGRWAGRLGPGANPTYAVTLELRANGGDVSGTLTGLDQAGDVRRGTYDPATGALKLDLGITGQPGVQLSLEGVAVHGTAVGRVTKGGSTGTFILTRAEAPVPRDDASSATISREQLRSAFDEVSGNITKAAALVPSDRYGYRPVASVRSFGELIGHVVDAYHYYCGRAAGRGVAWSDTTARGPTDKTTLAPRLEEAIASCNAAHATGSAGPLIVNYAHANLHYGNMVTYMRLLGVAPPSSR